MTLSHFLRDYLYIPLGGNRKDHTHRYLNLMIIMLLGGGYGMAPRLDVYSVGGLHGFDLVLDNGWQYLHKRFCLSG